MASAAFFVPNVTPASKVSPEINPVHRIFREPRKQRRAMRHFLRRRSREARGAPSSPGEEVPQTDAARAPAPPRPPDAPQSLHRSEEERPRGLTCGKRKPPPPPPPCRCRGGTFMLLAPALGWPRERERDAAAGRGSAGKTGPTMSWLAGERARLRRRLETETSSSLVLGKLRPLRAASQAAACEERRGSVNHTE